MKRLPILKKEPDCTGIGKWIGYLIFAVVVAACIIVAFKAKGQGLLGAGAALQAGARAVPTLKPVTPAAAVPGPGPSGCDGDTGPTVDLSDSIIVTTGGTSGGSGTQASPLSLTAALAGTGIMATTPNRVVLVRAGNYSAPSGGFVSSVDGTSGSPWLIRNYPGEAPVILGHGGAATAGRCMIISGSQFVTFRGLRFHNPTVAKGAAGQTYDSAGIKINTGNDVTFEHCIVSDNYGTGFDHGSTWGGQLTLKYNLAMLNGYDSATPTHGAYLHTYQSFSNIVEGNIFINNAGYAFHAYDSHNFSTFPNLHVNNFKISRNIMRKSNPTSIVSGGPLALFRNDTTAGNPGNLREDPGTGNVLVSNVMSGGSDTSVYRLDNHIGLVVRSNYFQLGVATVRYNWQNNFLENNRFVSGANPAIMLGQSGHPGPSDIDGFTLDNNVYNFYGSSTAWQYLGTARTFAQWKTDTGEDAASTGNTTNPTDTTRFIFQSTVDTNIIHFAILNEDAGATETIDFAAYWPPCGRITIRNAGNYDGTPVVNDVAYTGQPFTLPFSSSSLTYQQPLDGSMGTVSPSLEFYAGIAVRTPANPTLTQP